MMPLAWPDVTHAEVGNGFFLGLCTGLVGEEKGDEVEEVEVQQGEVGLPSPAAPLVVELMYPPRAELCTMAAVAGRASRSRRVDVPHVLMTRGVPTPFVSPQTLESRILELGVGAVHGREGGRSNKVVVFVVVEEGKGIVLPPKVTLLLDGERWSSCSSSLYSLSEQESEGERERRRWWRRSSR